MKTALKHASRDSWRRDHMAALSVPTSTSVSQIRPERDIGVRHHGDPSRRERVSKGEDAISRIKSEVTTSASSAFRWRIEHWRRRTNLSSTDQSRRTTSTSIGTDSRRLGSSSAQQRDRRDTLSIPIEESDLDLELSRSLSKSASRSGHMRYSMGSVGGTERSSRTGNIVLEHMRLEPIKQVSLVGNQTLIEEQHRRSLDYQRSSRKMSFTERSSIRPSLYDGTADSWSQIGRYDNNNTKTRKPSSIDLTLQRNQALNDKMSGPLSSQKRRYRKTTGRNRCHLHSLPSEQEDSIKDGAARHGGSRGPKIYGHLPSPDPEQRSKLSSRTYDQHPGKRGHLHLTEDERGLSADKSTSIVYRQLYPLNPPDSKRGLQESSKTCALRGEKGHLDPQRIPTIEQGGATPDMLQEEQINPSHDRHERNTYDDLPGSGHILRGETPVGDDRKVKRRSRRKRKKNSHQSQGNGKT